MGRPLSLIAFYIIIAGCHRSSDSGQPDARVEPSPVSTIATSAVDAAVAENARAESDAAAPIHYPPIKPKSVKFAALAKAVIPSFDPKKGRATVQAGKVKDVFGREATVPGPGSEGGRPGAIKDAGRLALKDGRLAAWLATDAPAGVLEETKGFLAIVHADDAGELVVDATGAWSNYGSGPPVKVKEQSLGGRIALVEDEHLEGTGEGGALEGVQIWLVNGNEVALASRFPTSGSLGPGSVADDGRCYAFCYFSTTMAFGETLELTQKTEWQFLDQSAEPPKCRATITLPAERATLRLADGKLVGEPPKDPREAVPGEAKPYLRGVARAKK